MASAGITGTENQDMGKTHEDEGDTMKHSFKQSGF
jgi:hypothetical protein